MVVNVVLNIVLVQVIGVSGIILSTVFSLVISIPWENYTIFRYVFSRSSRTYYKKMLFSAFSMLIAGGIAWWLCSLFGNGMFAFLLRGCVCIVVPNGIFAILNCKRTEFKDTLHFVQRIMKRQY